MAGGVLAGYAPQAMQAALAAAASPAARRWSVLAYQERAARYRLDVCQANAAANRRLAGRSNATKA